MNNEVFTRSGARRSGDDYQDIIAIGYFIEMLEHPNRYQWIKVEADGAKSLDDIILCHNDGKIDAIQVKYSMHSSNEKTKWTWDEILKQEVGKNGKELDSLFQKWYNSYIHLKQSLNKGILKTNRAASDEIKSCLVGTKILFDKINQPTIMLLLDQVSNDENSLKEFLSSFEWHFDQSSIQDYENNLKDRFFKIIGQNKEKWHLLKQAVNQWVIKKDEPSDDRMITIDILRSIIEWNLSPSIPQEFEIPVDYVVPDNDFHKTFMMNILSNKEARYLFLSGKPAVGKSTYLSFIANLLREKKIPVIRHHYFLSFDDHTCSRYDHRKIIESLMKDLIKIEYFKNAKDDENLQILNQNPRFNEFKEWLYNISQYLAKHDQQLIIIIDGLDHVWRDQNDISELRLLFDILLPTYEHISLIIGSQPVDDEFLPAKLLEIVPRDNWHNMPYLNIVAIKEWVLKFIKLNKIELFNNQVSKDYEKNYYKNLILSFKEKSLGHPLIIKYILRKLIDSNSSITPEYISSLPEIPDKDINNYYSRIWRSTSQDSRSLLGIYTASEFCWKDKDIIACANYLTTDKLTIYSSLRKVKYLFKDTLLGFIPFHSSLLLFIKDQDDYKAQEDFYLEIIEKWLINEAPPYWKWAYLWEIQKRRGNITGLIEGVRKEWVVDSIALGYPIYRILEICEICKFICFRTNNYKKLTEVSLLTVYIENFSLEYPTLLGDISLSQLRIKDDEIIKILWKSNIHSLSSKQLAKFAEELYCNSDMEYYNDIVDILNDRFKSNDTFDLNEKLADYFETVFLNDKIESNRISTYLLKNRNNKNHIIVVKNIINSLVKRKKNIILKTLLEKKLLQSEKYFTTNGLVFEALIDGFKIQNIDELLANSPMVVFYSFISNQKLESFDFNDTFKFNPSFLSHNNYDIINKKEAVIDGFYYSFFYFLSLHLMGIKPYKESSFSCKKNIWQDEFYNYLNDLASKYIHIFRQSPNTDIIKLLSSVSPPDPPSLQNNHDTYEIYRSAFDSYNQILFTLILGYYRFDNLKINTRHLNLLIENQYFDIWCFLRNILFHKIRILDLESVNWLTNEYNDLKKPHASVIRDSGSFRYSLISELNCLYNNFHMSKILIRKAIDCGIVYGYHKDPLSYNLLESLKEAILKDNNNKKLKKWILQLIPALVSIKDYTDGHAYHGLTCEFLYSINPSLALSYYDILIEKEEYHGALSVFHEILNYLDFKKYDNMMLGTTAIDNDSIEILLSKSDEDSNIQEVLSKISKVVGPLAIDNCRENLIKEKSRVYDKVLSIDYLLYTFDKLESFVTLMISSGTFSVEKYLQEWVNSWESTYSVDKRIEALDYFKKRLKVNTNLIEYHLISERDGYSIAYPYLIEYFNDKHGWSNYGLSDEQFNEIINIIISNHHDRLNEFFQVTMSTSSNSYKGFTDIAFNFRRVIRFFLEINNKDTAYEIINGVYNIYLDLVKPFNIDHFDLPLAIINNDDFAIEMIMRRLTWITPMVREQSSKTIADLLINSDYATTTQTIFLKNLSKQYLESRVIVFLMPLLRAKKLNYNFNLLFLEKVNNAITNPSYLSNLLLRELGFEVENSIDFEFRNDMPEGYTNCKNWEILISRFSPNLISYINNLELIGDQLMTRWSFEYEEIINYYKLTPDSSADNMGGLRENEHYIRLEIPYFEIGYSALLRMITWAIKILKIPKDIALYISLQCLPLDLDSVFIDFSEKPVWVPSIEQNNSLNIDTITPTLLSIGSNLCNQLIDNYRIGYFNARFVDSDTEKCDLKIEALYQKCCGPLSPNQLDIKNLTINAPIIFPKFALKSCTEYKSKFEENAVIQLQDWLLIPDYGIRYPFCLSFWHVNRIRRYLYLPIPYYPFIKEEQTINMKSMQNGIYYYIKEDLIGKWFEWVVNMPEQVYADIPQNTGNCLLLNHSFTNSFCQMNRLSLCWLITITRYSRKNDYSDFSKVEYKDLIGGSNIIMP